ncbi:flagellar biosynthetic protein FliO [Aliikangiella sp. IMCC44632]
MKTFLAYLICSARYASALLLTSVAFSIQAQESIEKNTLSVSPANNISSMLVGLFLVLVVIFFLAFLLKRFTSLNIVSNNIKVIESQSIGSKEKLVIVEIQDKQLVLGVTAHSINKVCELENKIEKKAVKMPFEKVMQQLMNPQKRFEQAKKPISRDAV